MSGLAVESTQASVMLPAVMNASSASPSKRHSPLFPLPKDIIIQSEKHKDVRSTQPNLNHQVPEGNQNTTNHQNKPLLTASQQQPSPPPPQSQQPHMSLHTNSTSNTHNDLPSSFPNNPHPIFLRAKQSTSTKASKYLLQQQQQHHQHKSYQQNNYSQNQSAGSVSYLDSQLMTDPLNQIQLSMSIVQGQQPQPQQQQQQQPQNQSQPFSNLLSPYDPHQNSTNHSRLNELRRRIASVDQQNIEQQQALAGISTPSYLNSHHHIELIPLSTQQKNASIFNQGTGVIPSARNNNNNNNNSTSTNNANNNVIPRSANSFHQLKRSTLQTPRLLAKLPLEEIEQLSIQMLVFEEFQEGVGNSSNKSKANKIEKRKVRSTTEQETSHANIQKSPRKPLKQSTKHAQQKQNNSQANNNNSNLSNVNAMAAAAAITSATSNINGMFPIGGIHSMHTKSRSKSAIDQRKQQQLLALSNGVNQFPLHPLDFTQEKQTNQHFPHQKHHHHQQQQQLYQQQTLAMAKRKISDENTSSSNYLSISVPYSIQQQQQQQQQYLQGTSAYNPNNENHSQTLATSTTATITTVPTVSCASTNAVPPLTERIGVQLKAIDPQDKQQLITKLIHSHEQTRRGSAHLHETVDDILRQYGIPAKRGKLLDLGNNRKHITNSSLNHHSKQPSIVSTSSEFVPQQNISTTTAAIVDGKSRGNMSQSAVTARATTTGAPIKPNNPNNNNNNNAKKQASFQTPFLQYISNQSIRQRHNRILSQRPHLPQASTAVQMHAQQKSAAIFHSYNNNSLQQQQHPSTASGGSTAAGVLSRISNKGSSVGEEKTRRFQQQFLSLVPQRYQQQYQYPSQMHVAQNSISSNNWSSFHSGDSISGDFQALNLRSHSSRLDSHQNLTTSGKQQSHHRLSESMEIVPQAPGIPIRKPMRDASSAGLGSSNIISTAAIPMNERSLAMRRISEGIEEIVLARRPESMEFLRYEDEETSISKKNIVYNPYYQRRKRSDEQKPSTAAVEGGNSHRSKEDEPIEGWNTSAFGQVEDQMLDGLSHI